MWLCLPLKDNGFPKVIYAIQCQRCLTRTLFLHTRHHKNIFTTDILEYLVTYTSSIIAAYIEGIANIKCQINFCVWRKVRYKSDTIKIVDIYVGILVPLVMLNDPRFHINNIQQSMLYHTRKNNYLIHRLDSELFPTPILTLYFLTFHYMTIVFSK